MFVTCRKKVKFTHPDNASVVWEMSPGFIGEIPKWVEGSWYFDALCKDGSITAIVSKKDKDIEDADAQAKRSAEAAAKAAAEKAEAERIEAENAKAEKTRLLDEAKAAAKAAAEDEAKQQGLDAAATKKFVAEKVKAAVDAIGKE